MRMALRNEPDYADYVQKYFEKTVKYVHRTTDIKNVENNLPVIEFGPANPRTQKGITGAIATHHF